MRTHWHRLASMLFLSALTAQLWAGGSGFNVVVVVNQSSTNSVQLGNYYCEKRQVPPQNLLRTTWAGGNTAWQKSDFQSVILTPLLSMLSARQLTNQIDYVLLSMDFPYRVEDGGSLGISGTNSTTSALFYGFKADYPPNVNPGSCSLPGASSNSYAGSECLFRSVAPGASRTNFLAVMLTASNLAQAKLVIDRAVAGDGTFPTQTVYLTKSSDVFRNVRYPLFDNAVFNTRLRDNYSMQRITANPPYYSLGQALGLQSGWGDRSVIGNTSFVPGALADNLTSWGGQVFEERGQLRIIALLNAGAAGSYGTVIEPCTYLAKFPSPQNYFYQARGFGMAESYYQSVTNPYQGLILGDPLAAPFAQPASGSWSGLPANSVLASTTNLSLQFTAADPNHPVQQVDLFVDGTFAQTLTNIPPRTNNVLYVTLNGYPTNYTVPSAATLQSVVSNLTLRLNQTSYTNATKVLAVAHGDRIELQSFNLAKAGSQIPLAVSNSAGSASALTTFLAASRSTFLDTVAYGIRAYSVSNSPRVGDYLQLAITRTNGGLVALAITNTVAGTTVSALAQGLVNMVNTNASLTNSDGVAAEDFIGYDPIYLIPLAEFNLRARSLGWPAAQIQANLSGSATFTITPTGTSRLEGNLPDLRPRNHLYLTAGVTNLLLTFPFNTTTQADGYHELTAVAYEGSHVRTQKRVTQTVRIQNSPLSATFTTLLGASNTLLGATLQFSVVANINNISKIELFSTGGSLASILNLTNATFSVPGTNLGVGLHPFYAIVTATSGKQYRTETQWIRLVAAQSPFRISLSRPAPVLAWTATPGRGYDILTAANLTNAFQLSATVTPSSSAGRWTDTNPAGPRRFYRVRTSDTAQSPFRISLSRPAPVLAWTATAGQSYDILTATNLTNVFQLSATLTPSNSAAQWIDTNPAVPRRFYRVRASN